MRHYPDRGSASGWLNFNQTSFCEGSSGDLGKRRLFSQAIRTHTEYDHVPVGLMAQLLRALHRCRRVHALESLPSLKFFWSVLFTIKLLWSTISLWNMSALVLYEGLIRARKERVILNRFAILYRLVVVPWSSFIFQSKHSHKFKILRQHDIIDICHVSNSSHQPRADYEISRRGLVCTLLTCLAPTKK